MRIGIDVAQTCQERAGCAWYADMLAQSMSRFAPENEYSLYHQFDNWHNPDTSKGTCLATPHHAPFKGMSSKQSNAAWTQIRKGAEIPHKPEVVHSTSFQAPRLTGTKLVFTVFDLSFWIHPEYTSEANRVACQSGILSALQNADGFVFISKSARQEFEKFFPSWLDKNKKPFAVTPLGIKRETTQRLRESGADSEPFWLSVGSLEPRKNIDTLLDALEIYWEESASPCPLKIAGGAGWKSGELKKRILRLSERGFVQQLGYVSEDELSRLYHSARAFIFPSWSEGFGLPILEAMSTGCPVITSMTTSLPEVGGDAVLYIDPSNKLSIVEKMLFLERHSDLAETLGKKGIVQASKYSWETTAKITLDLYKTLINQ